MPAPEYETEITGTFQVVAEDGTEHTVTEQTTYLVHLPDRARRVYQKDYSLNGESLYEAPIGSGVFKNAFGKTFR
jgi:hypothetical protein